MERSHCNHKSNMVGLYAEGASLASTSSDRGQSTSSSAFTEGNKPKPYDFIMDRMITGTSPANVLQGTLRTRATSSCYGQAV